MSLFEKSAFEGIVVIAMEYKRDIDADQHEMGPDNFAKEKE
jgi:hypothetical protein